MGRISVIAAVTPIIHVMVGMAQTAFNITTRLVMIILLYRMLLRMYSLRAGMDMVIKCKVDGYSTLSMRSARYYFLSSPRE
jgi:hypothetical protein